MAVYFDDSLPEMVKALEHLVGTENVSQGVALRDTSGRLCFFLAFQPNDATLIDMGARLTTALGVYARPDRVIVGAEDFGAQEVLESTDATTVKILGIQVRLIDRRLVGADWLRRPIGNAEGAPRFVFASLKGGVGRSTALTIAAAHVASRGLSVLCVDLDMEAPGLGAILLDENTVPRFGIIDALVERALSPLSDEFLQDLIGTSKISNRGRVDVVPAFGAVSLANPADVLAKIGRAYGEVVHDDGTVETILDQVSAIIGLLQNASRYDLVLVDARAGLHEVAAAALIGLGADLLCFGADEPQTFQGYKALFAHMQRYIQGSGIRDQWFNHVTMVQSKAPLDAALRAEFARKCDSIFSADDAADRSSSAGRGEVPLPEGFSDVAWDESISDLELGLTEATSLSEVVPVFWDSNFVNFDPLSRRDQASESFYRNTFGSLLVYIDNILQSNAGQINAAS